MHLARLLALQARWPKKLEKSRLFAVRGDTLRYALERIFSNSGSSAHSGRAGSIRYETRFAGPAQLLEITDAYEGVEVFVNGQSTGIQVVPPFRYDLRGLTQEGENSLVIEVATTLERERGKTKNASPTGITGEVALYG